jgi:hypothetical protein
MAVFTRAHPFAAMLVLCALLLAHGRPSLVSKTPQVLAVLDWADSGRLRALISAPPL